jgi:hypothetical protein
MLPLTFEASWLLVAAGVVGLVGFCVALGRSLNMRRAGAAGAHPVHGVFAVLDRRADTRRETRIRLTSASATPAKGPASVAPDVAELIEHLATLELRDWLDIGRIAADVQKRVPSYFGVRHCVDTVLAKHKQALTAWIVRDAIETAVTRVRHRAAGLLSADRRLLSIAGNAAVDAALALQVGDKLPARDLQIVCAPFARRMQQRDSAPKPLAVLRTS